MRSKIIIERDFSPNILIGIFILGLFSISIWKPVLAQTEETEEPEESPRVETVTGHIEPGRPAVYVIPNLVASNTFYVYAKSETGNLDPFIGIADRGIDIEEARADFWDKVQKAIEKGEDPLRVIPRSARQLFLVWDDDSGSGYDSALRWNVPADGDYLLIVGSNVVNDSAGDYTLTVGINAPEVLEGTTTTTGDVIAIPIKTEVSAIVSVDRTEGIITQEDLSSTIPLDDRRADETLSIYVEGLTGNLKPRIILKDFGGKPIRSGNFGGNSTVATLEYTFPERASGYTLEISGENSDGTITFGEFRALAGVNAPDVLLGTAEVGGESIFREPTVVEVTYQMDQISEVDQISENYAVVGSIILDWEDPALAFKPDTCQCEFKVFNYSEFSSFAGINNIQWPDFTIFNQQGNRWSQNRLIVVTSTGVARYYERFSATLQAPDFNFRQFPFDIQLFKFHLDSLFPIEKIQLSDKKGFSGIGEQLGEEEWSIIEFGTDISTQEAPNVHTRFTFEFNAEREITFYAVRFFIPVLLIILVSWITFFLQDYARRIEVTSANLLLFIAYNFTISSDLPRLGYLTFMDFLLMSTFLISVLVVVFNVFLRRMQVIGKEDLAHRIDNYSIWVYPLIYTVGFVLVYNYFFNV